MVRFLLERGLRLVLVNLGSGLFRGKCFSLIFDIFCYSGGVVFFRFICFLFVEWKGGFKWFVGLLVFRFKDFSFREKNVFSGFMG